MGDPLALRTGRHACATGAGKVDAGHSCYRGAVSTGARCGVLTGIALVAMSAPAQASNPTHARTPVDWSAQPCGLVHDRSAHGPVVRFDYDIPQEDVEGISDNEVDDARRHQFFALCRAHAVRDLLPTWIDQADIDAAAAKSLPPTEILEQNPEWQDCWWAITSDEERRPISFDAAAESVEWDTTGLPAGVYFIEGYTWDPPFNLWTARPGFIKIVDSPADRDAHPAVGIVGSNDVVAPDQPLTLTACSDAAPTSVFAVDVAVLSPGQAPDWIEVANGLPAPGPDGNVTFTPGEAFAEQAITVRLRSEDDQGREAVAYLPAELSLTSASDDPPDDDTGAPATDGGGCGVAPSSRDLPLRLAPWIALGWLLAGWASPRGSTRAHQRPQR